MLFSSHPSFHALRPVLSRLAAEGAFIGTSSWKYPGWLGQLYSEERYLTRNKFSNAKFEAGCLAEYAEVFSTVGVDAAYYTFPTPRWLESLASQVPSTFRFAFKVTDTITVKRFPNFARFGPRAGAMNPDFLNATRFTEEFLRPCEAIRPLVGLLMFEFSQFHDADFARGSDFTAALDTFLDQLPEGWSYAVEIRNPSFLDADYFDMLRRHGVAHLFNSWARMPAVSAQLAMPASRTSDFLAARFLLSPGRSYDQAVQAFSPYTETRAVDPDARAAAATIICEAQTTTRRPSFLLVNNRLEGNALNTIASFIEADGDKTGIAKP
jgi:uncharacterized protein YecE (DUF72 family)